MSSSSAGRSSAEPSALVEQLRTANTGLREVINAQAVRLEAQAEQLSTQAEQLSTQAELIAELQRRLSKRLNDLEQAAVLGLALPHAGAAVLASGVGTPPGQAARRGGDHDAPGR